MIGACILSVWLGACRPAEQAVHQVYRVDSKNKAVKAGPVDMVRLVLLLISSLCLLNVKSERRTPTH